MPASLETRQSLPCNGNDLVIEAKRTAPSDRYTQSVVLNGTSNHLCVIHLHIAIGAHLL